MTRDCEPINDPADEDLKQPLWNTSKVIYHRSPCVHFMPYLYLIKLNETTSLRWVEPRQQQMRWHLVGGRLGTNLRAACPIVRNIPTPDSF